jgi:hypothetical protein
MSSSSGFGSFLHFYDEVHWFCLVRRSSSLRPSRCGGLFTSDGQKTSRIGVVDPLVCSPSPSSPVLVTENPRALGVADVVAFLEVGV